MVSAIPWQYLPQNDQTKDLEMMNVTMVNLPFLGAAARALNLVELLEDGDHIYNSDFDKLFVTRPAKVS